MSYRRDMLGLSWGDIEAGGRVAFPYIHTAGGAVLSAFGAGALVKPIAQLEQSGGLLPTPPTVVQNPDFVVVTNKDGSSTTIAVPGEVAVQGGKHIAGNGYASVTDCGSKFSFGYDAPTSVEMTVQGKKTSFSSPKQVLFCGGVDTKPNIAGDVTMSKGILGTILGALFETPADDYTIGMQMGPGAGPAASTGGGGVLQPGSKYTKGAFAAAALAHGNVISAEPSAGFKFKTTPKGRKFTSLMLNKNAKSNPQKTIQNATIVAERAQRVGNAALARLAKAKPSKAVLGAPLRQAQAKLSISQLRGHASNLVKQGKDLADHVAKYKKVVQDTAAKRAAAALMARKVTKVHGMGEYFTDIVGDASWDEILGFDWEEITANDYDLALENAEVLGQFDGAPDPYGGGYGAPDPSGGSGAGYSSASQFPGPPDYGAGSPPTLGPTGITMSDGTVWPGPGDYMPDPYPNGDDPTFYDCPTDDSLPLGAVVFDGSRTPTYQQLGSYTFFFKQLPDGSDTKEGPGSGYQIHDDGWYIWRQNAWAGPAGSGDYRWTKTIPPDASQVEWAKQNNWGPFIGSPTGGWTKGLRFSPSGPNGPRWFWFWDTALKVAPWAVQGTLQAKLNEALTNYKASVTAGQTDYVNAQLQDKLDAQTADQQARSNAAADAVNAQQIQQADTQYAIQQQQQQGQMTAFQLQQAQQMSQQQAQQAQLQQQAQALQLQFFSEHPEAMFAPVDQGGGGEEGGGGGYDGEGYGSPGEVDEGAFDWGDGGDGYPSASEMEQESDALFPS